VKPELAKLENTYIFKKGKMINCTLKNAKEVIPPQVTYTWFSCDNVSCDVESVKREQYSLPLNSQARTDMFYKCIAKNAAGSDSWIIDVYNPEGMSKTDIRSYTLRTEPDFPRERNIRLCHFCGFVRPFLWFCSF
jgi:hypothetical protein